MSRRPRVAMVGMASENCTFSVARTSLEDFEVLEGDALRAARYSFLDDDEEDFEAVEFLPLMHARALPGGRITPATYGSLKDALLVRLEEALPLDGVLLDLHGAMHVEGMTDVEADLVRAVRSVVGQDCLLGASMDLHGNVSRALVERVDVFSAYRTAPHIDTEITRARVCRLLRDALENRWTLERAWVAIPVLLPGEMTSTLDEPGRSLYRGLTEFDGMPGVLDVSLWVGYVWADEPRAHASVVVTGIADQVDTDIADIAQTVARRYWDARSAFRFNVPSGSLAECLDRAIAAPVKPVVISDSGDNPTAGGVGNLPYALRVAHQCEDFLKGKKRVLIPGIWDAAAVEACTAAGREAAIELTIGRGCDSRHTSAFTVSGTVKHFFDDDPVAGRQVFFQIGKGITVVLTERRKPFHHFADFHQLGLKPEEADLVIVKIGYLVTDLQSLAAEAYLALTPGAVDQHITRVTYEHLERPMYPFDEDFTWEPQAVRV